MNETKATRMFDAVTSVPDEVIEEAREIRLEPPSGERRKTSPAWKWAAGIAAALALVAAGIVFIPRFAVPVGAEIIAEAEYPETGGKPIVRPAANPNGMGDFLRRTLPVLLGGSEGENRVCSPANVYVALSALTELTDGASRARLLELLGSGNLAAQRENARELWLGEYLEPGERGACVIANSIWLNEDLKYNPVTMQNLAENYYASSYRGKMGSEALNRALRDWLNTQTGGLLEDYVKDVSTDGRDVLELVSTLYFKGVWSGKFKENKNTEDVFHAADGDRTAVFMHSRETAAYYWGARFSAAAKSFSNGREMLFVLPDEGTSPEELLADAEFLDFITGDRYAWEQSKVLIVNLSVPKFDVSGKQDLIPALRSLGLAELCDPGKADFSPLLEGGGMDVFLGKAEHAARVKIDEEGCEAAAYTIVSAAGAGEPPSDETDLILDRPFLFFVVKRSAPLFAGIVGKP